MPVGELGEHALSTARTLWRRWWFRWFSAMLTTGYVAFGTSTAMESGRWQQLVFLALWVPFFAPFLAAMAAVAAGIRWVLARHRRPPIAAVVLVGALAGPFVVWLIFAIDDPRTLWRPDRAGLDGILAPPMVLGGAVSAWLAERQVSPRRAVWWAGTLLAAFVGIALLPLTEMLR